MDSSSRNYLIRDGTISEQNISNLQVNDKIVNEECRKMYQEINSVKKTNGERIGVDHKLLNTSYHSSIFNCAEFMDRRSLGSRLFLEAQHNVNLFSIGKTKDQKINQRDILGHTGCVNAVEFNKEETLLASGGDDMRVFVWNVSDLMMHKNPNPAAIMEMGHHSNIFSYQFSLECNGLITFYDRREDSSSKDGRMVIEQNCQIFRSQFNPANSSTFAIASNNGLHLYDLRMPKEVLVDLSDIVPESIYVEWNRTGTAVAALQSHKFPIYIDVCYFLFSWVIFIPLFGIVPVINYLRHVGWKRSLREPKFDTWHYPGVENNVPVETTAEDEQMLHYFDRLVMSTRHHTEYDSPFSDIEVGDIVVIEPDSDSDSGGDDDDEAEEKRLQNERIARRRRWELRQRGGSDSSTDSDEDKSKRRRLQSSDLITSDEEIKYFILSCPKLFLHIPLICSAVFVKIVNNKYCSQTFIVVL
uniref:WD_REPEATS_REGION domain-containing protein n=1 Tax=Heterorhabditis bacteriophora TaxID=37862 RepID=A0A1I7WEQ3_HETBA